MRIERVEEDSGQIQDMLESVDLRVGLGELWGSLRGAGGSFQASVLQPDEQLHGFMSSRCGSHEALSYGRA